MTIGTVLVLIYVLIGGMLAVAWTDFIQMIVLVVGLSFIAMLAGEQAGGATQVLDLAVSKQNWFKVLPEATVSGWLGFVGAAVTMMLDPFPSKTSSSA